MTLYGYARVSTEDQSLQRQLDALHGRGVDPEHVYTEKASGASERRPVLDHLLTDMLTTLWSRSGPTLPAHRTDHPHAGRASKPQHHRGIPVRERRHQHRRRPIQRDDPRRTRTTRTRPHRRAHPRRPRSSTRPWTPPRPAHQRHARAVRDRAHAPSPGKVVPRGSSRDRDLREHGGPNRTRRDPRPQELPGARTAAGHSPTVGTSSQARESEHRRTVPA